MPWPANSRPSQTSTETTMPKTPLKDHDVTVQRPGRKPEVLPIRALDTEAAKALAKRIAKSRGWKSAEVTKAEEKK